MIEPVIVRDGEVLGLWKMPRKEKRIHASLEPFEPLSAADRKAIDSEIEDVARFEGLPATLVG